MLGVDGLVADVTGDGLQDVLIDAFTGGSGACARWSVIDVAAADEVFGRDLCDGRIDPSVDPVGLSIDQAVYRRRRPALLPERVQDARCSPTTATGRGPSRRRTSATRLDRAGSRRCRAPSVGWAAWRASSSRAGTRTYGTPLDQDDALAPAEGSVDPTVEHDDWAPIEGVDDGVDRIAFVDGVRRVDARLTLDDPAPGPTPGLVRHVRGRRHRVGSRRRGAPRSTPVRDRALGGARRRAARADAARRPRAGRHHHHRARPTTPRA